MKRVLWVAPLSATLVTAGLGVSAFSQEQLGSGLGDLPAADASDLGSDPASPLIEPVEPVEPSAADLPPGTPTVDPSDPAIGNEVPVVDPAVDPSADSAVPTAPAPRPPGGVRPRGTSVAPIAPPTDPRRPVRPTQAGDDLDAADGLGAPLVPEADSPLDPERPIVNPLGPDAMPEDPLDPRVPVDPIDPRDPRLPSAVPGVAPGAVSPAPGAVDPGYARPVRPRREVRDETPRISLDAVVRNPVRIYDARLMAMTGDWTGATDATDVLLRRFPTDPRVPYLRYFVFARSGQHDLALNALRSAITLEETTPVRDYGRFLEPFQGADRFYLERVRRAAGELDTLGSLTIEPADDLANPARPVPGTAPPLPESPAPDATFDPDQPST